METAHRLTSIFCEVDDFCKELQRYFENKLLPGPVKGSRGPSGQITISEVMTLLIVFQMMGYRNFKTFYLGFISRYWKSYFPTLPSYNRFVELIHRAALPMMFFSQLKSGKRTGIYYIDSSCLPVCHLKRQRRHKVFRSIAEFGRTSVGWFFGLKLHLVINHLGNLIAFSITRGNKNDSKEAVPLLKKLEELAFGDKGYLGKKLFDELCQNGLKLITRKRKNMTEPLISKSEKQLLDQRGLIETVIGHLKHHYHVWHTRHRSMANAITHLLASLAAYSIEPLKLSAINLLSS